MVSGTRTWGASALGVLVTLTVALAPAQARATDTTTDCVPGIETLTVLPGGFNGVYDLGPGTMAVGASGNVPAYWKGTTVHALPLPDGYVRGSVNAVNQHGLMVGTVWEGNASVGFTYHVGDSAMQLLPDSNATVDVNDHGHVLGYQYTESGTEPREWVDGQVRRNLAARDPEIHIESVTAINNAGQIVGTGWKPRQNSPNGAPLSLLWPASATGKATRLTPAVDDGLKTPYWEVTNIDNAGRIFGHRHLTRFGVPEDFLSEAPYTTLTSPGILEGHDSSDFAAVSPSSSVVVGGAIDFSGENPMMAEYWPGSGPVLTLPPLYAGGTTWATAVSDDDRVAGSVAHSISDPALPAIWTCASQLAYLPGSNGNGA